MFVNVQHNKSEKHQCIIYGAGNDGVEAFITLLNNGVYVSAFCDQDINKQKMRIMNKRVISPEDLCANYERNSTSIYISTERYKEEIERMLLGAGFYNVYENKGGYQKKIVLENKYFWGRTTWYTVIEQSYTKKIFVYGKTKIDLKFIEKLQLTDIPIEGIITDDDGEFSGIPYISLDDVQKKYNIKDIMIYVLNDRVTKVDSLEKMGYKIGYHFRVAPYIYGGHRLVNPYTRPDVNCGYAYVDSEDFPGYTILGTGKYDYKIMVLGASATDEKYHYFPSWVSFLKKMLDEKGIRAKIYNGGAQAYTTQQNLIKMLRDIPVLRPDIVIDYGGGINVMNIIQKERLFHQQTPFSNNYSEKILESVDNARRIYIDDELINALYGTVEKKEICVGLRNTEIEDEVELAAYNYIYAVHCMKAICDANNIIFLNFLDPLMVYSEHLGKHDMEKLYNDDSFFAVKMFQNKAMDFRNKVVEQYDPEYQRDLTQILDGDEIYEDIWHPNEKGNYIIAEKIFEVLCEKIGK